MSDTDTINDYIASQPDWQRENLERFRKAMHDVEPEVEEAWKWSVPVFLVDGKLVCAMSTFKNHTKYNFFEGAKLPDEHGLFNSGLDSKQHRSINIADGETIDEQHLAALIATAVAQVR